jgi:hypothetical protein
MIKVLDEIEDLLGNRNLSDGSMRKAFEVEAVQTFDTGDCGIAEELNDKRMKCAQLLRKFKEDLQSIDLPTFKTREDLEEFCMKNSSIIFCSTNNSFHLREIQLKIDCLIIDSANLFNEYETLVPLCLPSLHSIILAGDEAKKPTVGNQVISYAYIFVSTKNVNRILTMFIICVTRLQFVGLSTRCIRCFSFSEITGPWIQSTSVA